MSRYRRHHRDDEEPVIGRFRMSDGEFVVCRSRPGTVRVYAPDEFRLIGGHRRLICTVTGFEGSEPESAFLASFAEPQWRAWRDAITRCAFAIAAETTPQAPPETTTVERTRPASTARPRPS